VSSVDEGAHHRPRNIDAVGSDLACRRRSISSRLSPLAGASGLLTWGLVACSRGTVAALAQLCTLLARCCLLLACSHTFASACPCAGVAARPSTSARGTQLLLFCSPVVRSIGAASVARRQLCDCGPRWRSDWAALQCRQQMRSPGLRTVANLRLSRASACIEHRARRCRGQIISRQASAIIVQGHDSAAPSHAAPHAAPFQGGSHASDATTDCASTGQSPPPPVLGQPAAHTAPHQERVGCTRGH
jgi:hypothetical protein